MIGLLAAIAAVIVVIGLHFCWQALLDKTLGIPLTITGCCLYLPVLLAAAAVGPLQGEVRWLALIIALDLAWLFTYGLARKRAALRAVRQFEGSSHPWGGETPWVFAVSRRFGVPELESFYSNHVEPVLTSHGQVIQCQSASMDLESPDHWTNRFGAVLELADIHILIDHESNPHTRLERERSLEIRREARGSKRLWHIPRTYGGVDIKATGGTWPSAITLTEKRRADRLHLSHRECVVSLPDLEVGVEFHQRFEQAIDTCRRLVWLGRRRDQRLMGWLGKGAKLVGEELEDSPETPSRQERLHEAGRAKSHLASVLADDLDSRALGARLELHDYPVAQRDALQARTRISTLRLGLYSGEPVLPRSFWETYRLLSDLMVTTVATEREEKGCLSLMAVPYVLAATLVYRLRFRKSIRRS